MGEIKKFVTKTKDTPVDRGRVEVEVDGYTIVALEPPEYVMSQLIATASRMAKFPEQLAGMFGFLDDVLEPASANHLNSRLKDWEDAYGVAELAELMQYLVDEFSAIQKARDGNRSERRAGAKNGRGKAGAKVIEGQTVPSGA